MGSGPQSEAGPIARLLAVRPHEVEDVRRLFAASFLLGAGLVLFYSASNAIFLTRYDIEALPWVYIVNAAVVIAVGGAYSASAKRVSSGAALLRLTAAMTASVAVLWCWALLSDDRLVAFVMATWFRLLFIYAVLGLWEVASVVFDIRQAKRLFAAIALGMMIAFVIGGALSPLFSALIGAPNMIGLAAVFLAIYTWRFGALLRASAISTSATPDASGPAGIGEIMRDRYSRRMAWMKTVTVLLLYVTEYVFYEQAASTFESEESLAGFLGLFLGSMTIVMVVVTGLVAGRYISRFGLRVATLTLPVGMALIAIPTGLYGSLVAVDTIFFALVCCTLATDHVLGNAIGEPSGAVLFQPMPPRHRMRVRLAVDGWLGSVALAIAGGLLLAMQAIDLDNVAPYLFLIAAVATGGIVIAVLQHQDYVGALRNVTSLGFSEWGGGGRPPIDRYELADLFANDTPGAAVAAVGLARSLDDNPIGPIAGELLGHDSPDVVALALDAIRDEADPARRSLVADVVTDGARPDHLRCRALVTLAHLDPETAVEHVANPAFAPVVAEVLLLHPERRSEGEQLLHELAAGSIDDRLDACRQAAPDSALVIALLDDEHEPVRTAALDHIGGPVGQPALERVLDLAADPQHRRAAGGALHRIEADVPGAVVDRIAGLRPRVQADLIRAGMTEHVSAGGHVRSLLDAPSTHPMVRRACQDIALLHCLRSPDESTWLTDDDLERPRAIAAAHAVVVEREPALAMALADEFESSRAVVFGGLALDGNAARIRDLELLIRHGDDDDRANAIEALDVTLDDPRKRRILELLEPTEVGELADAAPTAPFDEVVQSLADDPSLTPWTRLLAQRAQNDLDEEIMTTSIDRVLALKNVDIFSELSYDALAELAERARREIFDAGSTILEQGAAGDELFALVSGTVRVDGPAGTTELSGHTVFGELAVVDPAPRSASVTAITDVEALVVSRRVILALTERRPEVMTSIAKVLARRVRG